jgi:polar amino acid transport system substrate-binding protein
MINRVVGSLLAVLLLTPSSMLAQTLTIYCEDDPPSQFRNPDNSLGGYAVDLVREIQKRVHNNDPILMVPWVRGYYAIQHAPDVLLFSMARTAERNQLFQWIGPILESQYGFFVKADSKIVITSMDDAKKLGDIGVYRDDVRDLFLTKAGFTNLDRITDNDDNIKKLMAGRIDAYAGSLTGLADVLKYAGFQMTDVKLAFVFLKSQSYIAASRGMSDSVVKAWDNALSAMKADGTFKAILSRYYPGVPMPGPAVTTFN